MDNDDDSEADIGGGGGGEEDDSEERSESSDEDHENKFNVMLRRVHQNDPDTTELRGTRYDERVQNMTDEEWQELGQDIVNNSHLVALHLFEGAIDDQKMSFFFRGLTRSSTITEMHLNHNRLSITGVRSMVPFLHANNSVRYLDLGGNNIQSEGFNLLFRALRDSPVEMLCCDRCRIDSIEIDSDHIPHRLKSLFLYGNNINADGCRELAKLLKGRDAGGNSALKVLGLSSNKIDDAGVAILVDALQNNTSLETLHLGGNHDTSIQGQIMLLKLVNDIYSIQATLQSNRNLRYLSVTDNDEIQTHINMATTINKSYGSNPELAGREKVIQTQLASVKRAELAHLQGVNRSLYSEINPLHLPEVLSLIGRRHGQGEVFVALRASIIGLFSTINMKQFIQQERKYHEAKIAEHRAKIEELDAKLAAMDEAVGMNQDDTEESQSNKRRRT